MKNLQILLVFAIVLSCAAPKKTEEGISKDQAKELKKAQKETELKAQYDSLKKIIETRQFVVEANFISNQKGRRIYVQSNLNFVKLDTTTAVIQIGSVTGYGYNGLGGVTAEGRISSWKIDTNEKKKTFEIEFNVLTNLGIFDVYITAFANGNATAIISGLRPGRLQYDGQIIPLEQSTIFKGFSR